MFGDIHLRAGKPRDNKCSKESLGPGFAASRNTSILRFPFCNQTLPGKEIVVRLRCNPACHQPIPDIPSPTILGNPFSLTGKDIYNISHPFWIQFAPFQPHAWESWRSLAKITYRKAGDFAKLP